MLKALINLLSFKFIDFFFHIIIFFNTSIKRKWLRTIYESFKDLERKLFLQSKLIFANNAISSCFFFFFLIIDLYF